MASICTLTEAIHSHVANGATIALEGFTHLIPSSAEIESTAVEIVVVGGGRTM